MHFFQIKVDLIIFTILHIVFMHYTKILMFYLNAVE